MESNTSNTHTPAQPKVDAEKLKTICREFLTAIGEDPDRAGLSDTPRRFASMWREFIEYDPGNMDTAFEEIEADQMIVVRGMKVNSFCEHHILPFDASVTIAYIPTTKVLGLSKFGRIAHYFAHRLQIQERLGKQIADYIEQVAETPDVAVAIEGQHSCMSRRGVKTHADMVNSVVRGRFKEDAQTRNEFLAIAGIGK